MRVASRWRKVRSWVTNTTAPGIAREEILEPDDRVDIEMIGRFVEQQHVRLADERARQQHAPAPSARQGVDDRVRRQRQPRQHQVDVMLAQPLLVGLEMMRVPFGDDVEDRSIGRQRHVLLEPRQAKAGLPPDGPGIRRQLAAENFEQRRLAGAVAADDRHALARVDLQRNFVKQWEMAEGHRHAVQRQKSPRGHLINVPRRAYNRAELTARPSIP